MSDPRTLIYACSGCSNVAQLANDVAVHLHRSGEATMSCIAGIGGNVAPLVKQLHSSAQLIGIDGCQLHCVAACMAQHNITPDHHIRLYELGYRKRNTDEASPEEFDHVLEHVRSLLPVKGD